MSDLRTALEKVLPSEIVVKDKMHDYTKLLGKRIVNVKKIHNSEFEVNINNLGMGRGTTDLKYILTCEDGTEVTV